MLDHSFWKLITDSGNPEKVIKKNQNGRSSKFRTGDQVKPEWVIKLGRNMHCFQSLQNFQFFQQ
ncbi:MAG: hypothetical protein CML06_20670 [Pseudomonadales bacterium]|nr:hypothetical protein [Pseudomonadales bacterium]